MDLCTLSLLHFFFLQTEKRLSDSIAPKTETVLQFAELLEKGLAERDSG